MFPEGLYSGLRVGQGTGESKDKKTPYIYVECEVRHYAVAGAWQPVPSPQKVNVKMYLTDGAWPSTSEKLAALGFMGNLAKPGFDPATANQGIELRCTHEPYTNPQTGKTRTNERWELEGWGGDTHAPITDASKLDVFTARWRQEKGAPPVGGAPAPSVPAGAMPPPPGKQATGVVQTSAGAFPTSQAPSPQAAGAAPTAAPAVSTSTPGAAPGAGSGPPPMAYTAPPVTAQTRTRNEVWANATKAHPDIPVDVLAMKWAKALVDLRPGKPETSFTGEDWFAVESLLVAPF